MHDFCITSAHSVQIHPQSGADTTAVIVDKVVVERAVIEDIMEELGLSEAERQTAIQLGQNETFAVLRAMDDSKKEQLGDFIARVIYADSKIYPIEEKFFKSMKVYLGLPDKDY